MSTDLGVYLHHFSDQAGRTLMYSCCSVVPCGITDKGVTCMAKELGGLLDMEEVKTRLKLELADLFDVELV